MEKYIFEYDDVKDFLSGLKFRKGLVGPREDAVFAAMQKLDGMYKKKIEDCQTIFEQYESRILELEKELAQAEAENEVLQARAAEARDLSAEYGDKAGQITRVIESIHSVQDSLIEKAKQEAESLISQTENELRQEEQQRREDLEELERVKKGAVAELKHVQETVRDLNRTLSNLQMEIDTRVDAATQSGA